MGAWRYFTNFNNALSISYRDDIKTVSQDEIAKLCLSAYMRVNSCMFEAIVKWKKALIKECCLNLKPEESPDKRMLLELETWLTEARKYRVRWVMNLLEEEG